MANYLQVMTATLSYGMKFPDALIELFTPVQKLGTSSQTLLSFDCFARSTNITLFTPSTAFMKIFLLAILPIILFVLFFILFGVFHLAFPKWFTDFKRNIAVSTITILFLLHPTITETAFGMFQWIQVDEGVSKVRIDLNIDCFSLEHIAWWFILSVPMLIIWVFGCPILALIILIKNRKNLENNNFQRYFIVLYQGLKNDKFYWEFVNTSRKVAIVTINVFLSQYPQFYKGASAIILMVIFLRIQLHLDPYKLFANNECEYLSFVASCTTLFGGILYVTDVVRVGAVDIIAFIVIVIVNIYFILFWSYLMSFNFHRFSWARKFTLYLEKLLMRKDESRRIISYSTERKSILVNNSQAEKSGRRKKYTFYLIFIPS